MTIHEEYEEMRSLVCALSEAYQEQRVEFVKLMNLADNVMAWDNNALDDPDACPEYKNTIERLLRFIAEHEGYRV